MSNPAAALQQLHQNLSKVVQCPPQILMQTMACLLCGGHLLIEDVPGVGKTTLTRTLAKSLQLPSKRVQCTPDLMPADILGFSFYDQQSQTMRRVPGPIFTNLLLMDELNRASPRTQAALLEAMNDSSISIEGETLLLPAPFMLVATRNPDDFLGTYALPEPLLDRFFMRISLGYPSAEQELAILTAQQQGHPLDQIKPVMDDRTLLQLQKICEKVVLGEPILNYISQLVRATREHPQVQLGASPRAALALMKATRAMAVLTNRKTITPALVQPLLEPVLGHRLVFRDGRLNQAVHRAEFWLDLLERVDTPDARVAVKTP